MHSPCRLLIRCDKADFKSLKLKLSSCPLPLLWVAYQRQYHTQNFDLLNVEMERGGRGFLLCFCCSLWLSPSRFSSPYFSLFYSLLCSKLSHQKFSSKIICEKVCWAYLEVRDGHLTLNSISQDWSACCKGKESLNWVPYCGPVTWAW